MKRPFVLPGLILSLAALLAASPGCDKQGIGERCSLLNGNDDCNSGLSCVQGARTTVCCPESGTTEDKRCNPSVGQGGSAGSAGTGGSAGTTTSSTGGAAGSTGGTSGGSSGSGGSAGAAGTAGSAGMSSGSGSGGSM